MADNVAVTAGAGTTIAADEVVDATLGTVKVQYVKLIDGTLDSTTKVGATANGLKVDGSAVTQPISGTVTVQQTTASSLNANVSGTVTANIGTAGTLATSAKQPALGTAGTASADVITVQGIASMTPLSVNASQTGTWTVQPGNTANTTAWKVQLYDGTTALPVLAGSSGAPAASVPALAVSVRDANSNGAATPANSAPVVQGYGTPATFVTAGASTNANQIKASAGQLYWINAINTTATIYYLKIFDKATAATLGTDTPKINIPIPASTSGAGVNIPLPVGGVNFTLGIQTAVTGGIALLDATNSAAGIALNFSYA